ncbi:hypothetical protein ACFV2X_26035 [Streptomyces sp. NPDC059679]|uniref:hypothetical protein n=1 Tax=Streptomyces sp. NPDC059679 TaxID=3346903 RepID=UPI00367C58CE
MSGAPQPEAGGAPCEGLGSGGPASSARPRAAAASGSVPAAGPIPSPSSGSGRRPRRVDDARRAEGRGDGAPGGGEAAATGAVGRGSADPVRGLMRRHRELCAGAVDPLEIAAGLEAHGVTDRTAARFRHRDVFSLAEELYARVPRDDEGPGGPDASAAVPSRGRVGGRLAVGALHLVPGALGVATVVGLARARGGAVGERVAAGVGGGALVMAALWLCLARGPLKVRGGGLAGLLRVGWLIAYALCGDWLLDGARTGAWRPYDVAPAAEAAVVLALAVAPAAWCARWFARRARRRLVGSRGLAEFAAGVRPLLAGTVALFLCALPPLVLAVQLAVRFALPLPGRPPGAVPTAVASDVVAVCVLLFVARLLAVHGFRRAAATGTAVACAAEAAVLGGTVVGRLPGGEAFAEAVARASAVCGPAGLPAAVCGVTALALLAYAFAALSRASAHTSGTPGVPYAPYLTASRAPLHPITTRST